MYDEVSESFNVVDKVNEELIAFLEPSEKCDEHEQYITDLEKVRNDLYASLVKVTVETKKPALSIKKLEPPKFSGAIVAFPTFVKDYERLVVAQQGKDPYVLRNS